MAGRRWRRGGGGTGWLIFVLPAPSPRLHPPPSPSVLTLIPTCAVAGIRRASRRPVAACRRRLPSPATACNRRHRPRPRAAYANAARTRGVRVPGRAPRDKTAINKQGWKVCSARGAGVTAVCGQRPACANGSPLTARHRGMDSRAPALVHTRASSGPARRLCGGAAASVRRRGCVCAAARLRGSREGTPDRRDSGPPARGAAHGRARLTPCPLERRDSQRRSAPAHSGAPR